MNSRGEICIGTAGAGRATELHINALKRYSGEMLCLRKIIGKPVEQAEAAGKLYGFEQSGSDFNELLNDPEIDIIDICTPPYLHEEMIIKAVQAGKHVICEKPLCGYFGRPGDPEPVGKRVSKSVMYEEVLSSLERIKSAVAASGKKFMYAENFIYAPAVTKAAEIINRKKSKILYAKGEESLKGSSSPVAGQWSKTGGGTFIRTGTHPLTAILWLKQQEAVSRNEKISVVSVIADMGEITPGLSEYDHRHIAARPEDVEDSGTVIITFSDGTKALIVATDTLLGGSRNDVELYCNDAVINCKLTMSNMMNTYFLDEERLDEVYLSEMLPAKTGWNHPFLEDEIIRGYVDEMRDFIDAVRLDREPKSGIDIACETMKVIYAAYKSAETGSRVYL